MEPPHRTRRPERPGAPPRPAARAGPGAAPRPGASARERDAVVRPLGDRSAADVAFAGAAGARLAAEAAASAPGAVRGFVIGAPAFARLHDAGDLRGRLAAALCDVTPSDGGRLMGAAQLARSLVRCEPLPPALADELERAYRALVADDRDAPVAVTLSEATPVGVEAPTVEAHGTGSFFRAVRRCWAAHYDARRVLARAVRGLPQLDAGAAVVVRRLPDGGADPSATASSRAA